MRQSKKIILATGGTGGHTVSAIAFFEVLSDYDVYFFSDTLVLKDKTFVFNFKKNWLGFLISFPVDFFLVYKKMKEISPDLIIGFGGYASFIPILCGYIMGIKLCVFEPNYIPGFVNRFFSNLGVKVLTAFKDTSVKNKFFTGMPLRRGFYETTRQKARSLLGVDNHFVILVMGGSQGARSINKFIVENLVYLKDYFIIHITGRKHYEYIKPFYSDFKNSKLIDYTDEIHKYMFASDIIVSRAGAGSIFEIMAVGVPAILIPYPYAKKKHQHFNARAVENSVIIDEQDLNIERFLYAIDSLKGKFMPPKISDVEVIKNFVKSIL